MLPKGMRAVAVDISTVTSAGGFILPDDRVDVVLTRRDKAAEKSTGVEKFISDTILRNVLVLAVDQTIDAKADAKVALGKTATLEVTQSQAEMLDLSHQLGTISLTLRSIRDSGSSAPEGEDEADNHQQSINTVRFGVSTAGTGN
jgi:pilus assembly protein CpaB